MHCDDSREGAQKPRFLLGPGIEPYLGRFQHTQITDHTLNGMHVIDIAIFVVYMAVMLGIGFFFMRRNESVEDYYVGGRNIGSWHVGLSVVATDVGGGFSIGLGGLGFTMGISGSWMLFTGLIGAWLSAVILIPRVKDNPAFNDCLTFPDIFRHFYDGRVAILAGLISGIGYLGFTAAQILAGAKLASGTIDGLSTPIALLIMGVVVVAYTALGGLKAVIYTDTIQWIVLMVGLVFIGLPIGYFAIGGYDAISATLPAKFLSFGNLTWQQVIYWTVTIIPIWFIAMTLYQRIYACRDTKSARKAWFIAGLFEWPVMAMMGVLLGLFARVAAEQGMFASVAGAGTLDPETGLPLLLRTILPVGLTGLMLSSYFSAILSTADSCLMAASGNFVSDIINRFIRIDSNTDRYLRFSQIATLALGAISLLLAWRMTSVLDLMLESYSFMVSGLLVPVIGAFFWNRSTATAALWSMLVGGTTTVALSVLSGTLVFATPPLTMPFGLDPNIYGIAASALVFVTLSLSSPNVEEPIPDDYLQHDTPAG